MTANEFTGVKDIRGCFLYRTDGYIMSYLRVYFLNLDLLSEADRPRQKSSHVPLRVRRRTLYMRLIRGRLILTSIKMSLRTGTKRN